MSNEKTVMLYGKLQMSCKTDLETGKDRIMVRYNSPDSPYEQWCFVDELVVQNIKYIVPPRNYTSK